MVGFSKINHKAKTIFYVDYSSFANDKATQKMKTIELRKYVTSEYLKEMKKTVLSIINLSNMYFDMEVIKVFKEEGDRTAPYEKKTAVIGISGLVKTGYNFVVGITNKNYRVFDSESEAKEWLVNEI